MNFLTEFKPRKTKFGFKTQIDGPTFMERSAALHTCLVNGPLGKLNHSIEIKTQGIYSSCDLLIYTDDEITAQFIRMKIEAANAVQAVRVLP